MWIDAGKPKHGPVVNTSTARFKYAILLYKNHEYQLKKDSLAKGFVRVGQMTFGKRYAR